MKPLGGGAYSSHRSLRSQILNRLLPLVVALFALSGAVAYFAARHHAESVHDRSLADSAEALAQRVVLIRGLPTLDLPEQARQILQWDADDTTWYQLRGDRSGHIAGHPTIPTRPPTGAVRQRAVTLYDAAINGARVRVAAVPVRLDGSSEQFEVRVAETLRKRNTLATEMLLSVMLPQLVLAGLALLVVWATLKQLVFPIGEVARALETQTHHSLEPVDDRNLPSEVAPLTHAMNDLLLRLKDALAAQRNFIADAAHQLRTPLTALKLHADEAVDETDPSKIRPLLVEVQRAAGRAIRLSSQLLTLARSEPSARIEKPRLFDIRQVLSDSVSHWVPSAVDAGVDLGVAEASSEALLVSGDPALLGEAIHNLIDNAIRYAGRNAHVTVSAEATVGDRILLKVDDNGSGIPERDRKRVLQRFHRVTSAQGPGVESAVGVGLGLAIVSEIAKAHGGVVRIKDGLSGRGTCVVLELPRAVNLPASDGGDLLAGQVPRNEAYFPADAG